MTHRVAILDFGSQTTQLIARRVREAGVYCEVMPCTVSLERIQTYGPDALILSGGPASVTSEFSPRPHPAIVELPIPMLGICYGMQVLVEMLGGKVTPALTHEFGHAAVEPVRESTLFHGVDGDHVWMSHGDQVDILPDGFVPTLKSATCPFAAIEDVGAKKYAVQFHPEVVHTPGGRQIIENFLFKIAELSGDWSMASFLDDKVDALRTQIGEGRVVMGLSGGVDSSVAAALIHKAVGSQLTCVYVDHGLHRTGEIEEVQALFGDAFEMDLRVVHARQRFFDALEGVTDPEVKRKRIGHVFIDVFEEVATELGDVAFLGQGTLYPDVIESVSFHGGPSAVIKSHHNVGGLPERMKLELVEPLRELFKDEVRALGAELGLPKHVLMRQPFPGPGLAIRVLGEVTFERCETARAADLIVREEIDAALRGELAGAQLWQWFSVLLPVRSVGVMGDARTYDETVCVRIVESADGMTADWPDLPKSVLSKISGRIINEVRGVNRVVYDISSKPPATIEWE